MNPIIMTLQFDTHEMHRRARLVPLTRWDTAAYAVEFRRGRCLRRRHPHVRLVSLAGGRRGPHRTETHPGTFRPMTWANQPDPDTGAARGGPAALALL